MQNTINIDEVPSNKKHSGGPRTEEGKKRSSANSLKHGIFAKVAMLPGELPEQFEELHNGMIEDLKPHGTTEECLVRRLAETQWRAGRILNAETDAILKAQEKGESCDKAIERFGKYSGQLTREFQTLLKTLKDHQAKRLEVHGQEFRQAVLIRDHYTRQGIDWDPADDEFVFSKDLLDQQLRFNKQWDRVVRNVHIYATTKYQDERFLRKAV